jgi:hypothetical protein
MSATSTFSVLALVKKFIPTVADLLEKFNFVEVPAATPVCVKLIPHLGVGP